MVRPVLGANSEKYYKHGALGLAETIAQDFGLCIRRYAQEYNAGVAGAYQCLVRELRDLANHPVISLCCPSDVLRSVGLRIANKEIRDMPQLTANVFNQSTEDPTKQLIGGTTNNKRLELVSCNVRPVIHYKIKEIAKEKGISKSKVISDILEDYFDREKEVDIWKK